MVAKIDAGTLGGVVIPIVITSYSIHYTKLYDSTQVGACIVNEDRKIVGVGYNGFPIGMDDDELPWEREGAWLDTKYPYVCHAELNAILNSISSNLKGCTIYVGLFPCNECAKAIIQSGSYNFV